MPLEFFAPVSSSVGVQLLQKMGWRQGRGIGSTKSAPTTGTAAGAASRRRPKQAKTVAEDLPGFGDLAAMAGFRAPSAAAAAAGGGSDSEGEDGGDQAGGSKWGTVAGVSIENTPLYVLEPKQDTHGLGFDPFEGAEEFRARKRQKQEASRAAVGGLGSGSSRQQQGQGQGAAGGFGPGGRGDGSRGRGVAFGTGALEDTDVLGYVEDYVDADAELLMRSKGQRKEVYAYEEGSESGEGVRTPLNGMAGHLRGVRMCVQTQQQLRAGAAAVTGSSRRYVGVAAAGALTAMCMAGSIYMSGLFICRLRLCMASSQSSWPLVGLNDAC